MSSAARPVLVERRGATLLVTINRPDVRNAVNPEVADLVAAAMDELDNSPELRVGVLTGAGGSFCSGMDLRHAAATGERPIVEGRGFAGLVERPSTKPLVAAVEGPAVGGGCEIALACDLIVAAESSTFALPEVTRGLLPGGGGLFRLPTRMPHHLAVELILTGAPIDAPRAHAVGLVNRVVPDGAAADEAVALAAAIALNAPVAVAMATQVVRLVASDPGGDWWERQIPYVERVRSTVDAVEGPQAFAEGRPPQWTGS